MKYCCDLSDVTAALNRIRPFIHKTPLMTSSTLNEMTGHKIYLKAENLQVRLSCCIFIPTMMLLYVCVFMALITAMVLCGRSQDLVLYVSVRRVHVVLSTAGFKGGG